MQFAWIVWVFLSWLASTLTITGLLLPHWLKGQILHIDGDQNQAVRSEFSDIGIFRRCGFPKYSSNAEVIINHECGHYSSFGDIPHAAWRFAIVVLSIACCTLFLSTFLLAGLGFCRWLLGVAKVVVSIASAQMFGGFLVLLGCMVYPLGWPDNAEVMQICGSKVTYMDPGRCHVGWAYVLTVAGGFLSLFGCLFAYLLIKDENSRQPNEYMTCQTMDNVDQYVIVDNPPTCHKQHYGHACDSGCAEIGCAV